MINHSQMPLWISWIFSHSRWQCYRYVAWKSGWIQNATDNIKSRADQRINASRHLHSGKNFPGRVFNRVRAFVKIWNIFLLPEKDSGIVRWIRSPNEFLRSLPELFARNSNWYPGKFRILCVTLKVMSGIFFLYRFLARDPGKKYRVTHATRLIIAFQHPASRAPEYLFPLAGARASGVLGGSTIRRRQNDKSCRINGLNWALFAKRGQNWTSYNAFGAPLNRV